MGRIIPVPFQRHIGAVLAARGGPTCSRCMLCWRTEVLQTVRLINSPIYSAYSICTPGQVSCMSPADWLKHLLALNRGPSWGNASDTHLGITNDLEPNTDTKGRKETQRKTCSKLTDLMITGKSKLSFLPFD